MKWFSISVLTFPPHFFPQIFRFHQNHTNPTTLFSALLHIKFARIDLCRICGIPKKIINDKNNRCSALRYAYVELSFLSIFPIIFSRFKYPFRFSLVFYVHSRKICGNIVDGYNKKFCYYNLYLYLLINVLRGVCHGNWR